MKPVKINKSGQEPTKLPVVDLNMLIQKQPSRGVLRKRCSENMLRNFIEITLRHGCSPVNLLHIFGLPFSKNTSGRLLLLTRSALTFQTTWSV